MRPSKIVALALAMSGVVIAAGGAFAATEKVVYAFKGGADGATPSGALLNVGGTLYGTTSGGGNTGCGNSGCGTVFKLNPTTGVETVLYTFTGGADGANPQYGLINVNGTLYGVTTGGGASFNGTVFSLNPTTGALTSAYSFKGGSDGATPNGALTNVGGTLYGVTSDGGKHTSGCFSQGCGTVYAVNPTTNAEAVVYAFSGGADGANPQGTPVSVGGALYGLTNWGGGCSSNAQFGCGTLYKIAQKTGKKTVAVAFQDSPDASYPYFSSLINVAGILYGTSSAGGLGNGGTIFTYTPATGVESIALNFDGSYGYNPSPLLNVGGTLYGTTNSGGPSQWGSVFQFNPATSQTSLVYSFKGGTDGGNPAFGSPLITVGGTLYGVTNVGGKGCPSFFSGCGTVFAITP